MQQDRLGPLKKSRQAVVLPSLVLVTMVLVVLATALLSSGTSSLRLSTFDQQSDQALYAAEAGLARAVEEYLRAGTETLPETYTGTLDQADAQFVVTTYENGSTTDDRTIPGGPSIPPRTIYLLSEGTSSNGTKRRAGALFRTG
ncbi:MAG: hypothetical protein WC314_00005, partial [Vulcanimicrobiota bacterium]